MLKKFYNKNKRVIISVSAVLLIILFIMPNIFWIIFGCYAAAFAAVFIKVFIIDPVRSRQ